MISENNKAQRLNWATYHRGVCLSKFNGIVIEKIERLLCLVINRYGSIIYISYRPENHIVGYNL